MSIAGAGARGRREPGGRGLLARADRALRAGPRGPRALPRALLRAGPAEKPPLKHFDDLYPIVIITQHNSSNEMAR